MQVSFPAADDRLGECGGKPAELGNTRAAARFARPLTLRMPHCFSPERGAAPLVMVGVCVHMHACVRHVCLSSWRGFGIWMHACVRSPIVMVAAWWARVHVYACVWPPAPVVMLVGVCICMHMHTGRCPPYGAMTHIHTHAYAYAGRCPPWRDGLGANWTRLQRWGPRMRTTSYHDRRSRDPGTLAMYTSS